MGGNTSKSSCCGGELCKTSPPRTLCYGLVTSSSRQAVPLQGIWVDLQVKGFVVDVLATIKYKNKEKKAEETVFIVPVDEDSAIYSFEATIEGKKTIADLQVRNQDCKTHDEAVSRGQETFHLMDDENSLNIFSCRVGNLPPGQEAEVTLKYVQELPVEAGGAVRFLLPDVLNPRFTPKGQTKSIRPQVPYTFGVNAHFKSAYGIAKIESNCDITPVEYTDNDKTGAKVSLAEGYKFDRDVELLAYYTDVNKPSVMVEAGLGSTDKDKELGEGSTGSLMADPVAMLNFYPAFPEAMEESSCKEFIFLMDRSASMKCTIVYAPNKPRRIQSAKETLVLLLKSLPLGCYFNIIGFGSCFESIFPESVEYTQQSMEEAVQKVNEMDADLGGTEFLQPLKKIYGTAGKKGYLRQLFVFTDGEVEKKIEKEVIAEIQKNAHKHQCFTFGIGCGASTSLVKGMARAGTGTFVFISDKYRMQPTVLQTLKRSLQPTARNIAVSLTWTLPPGVEANVLSSLPAGVLQGERSIVYVQLKGKVENEAEGEVCLQYKLQDEIVKNSLRFPLTVQKAERLTIHRLAAKALICELEYGTESDSEEVKKKILETSLQSGVISSLTTFVAINKDTNMRLEGPSIHEDVPDSGPYGSGGHFHRDPHEGPSVFYGHYYDGPEADWLISLQNADGSWNLTAEFSATLGVSKKDIKAGNPDQDMEVSVWVTVLAVIWLHTSCLCHRAEWELLEGKAISWVRPRAGSSLGEFVRAGNKLLKSNVDPKVFGL
ncbi:von Willebrand factor A domain-containing protein 5A-like [Mantella aurantiaca]